MRNLALIGAGAALGLGVDLKGPIRWTPSRDEVTFIPSPPKPLTKRQKRRLRGKGKLSA